MSSMESLSNPQVVEDSETIWQEYTGNLFVNGVEHQDIRQGGLGDCYFLAALAELADHQPDVIQNMIYQQDEYTYAVTFNPYWSSETYYIDNQLPANTDGDSIYAAYEEEGWVALLEKAYAHINSFRDLQGPSQFTAGLNSYQSTQVCHLSIR